MKTVLETKKKELTGAALFPLVLMSVVTYFRFFFAGENENVVYLYPRIMVLLLASFFLVLILRFSVVRKLKKYS